MDKRATAARDTRHDLPVLRSTALLLVLFTFAAGGMTLALADSATPGAAVTKQKAEAFARAVDLRAGDLPGSKALEGAAFAPGAVQFKALSCARPRAGALRPVAGRESWLVHGGLIGSVVLVAPRRHQVEADLAALRSRRGRSCLSRALGSAMTFERHGRLESSHTVRTTFTPVAEILGPESTALHVVAKLPPVEGETPALQRKGFYFHAEAAFFGAGAAEVAFFAVGEARLPSATEARLLTLLHERAEKSPLAPAGG